MFLYLKDKKDKVFTIKLLLKVCICLTRTGFGTRQTIGLRGPIFKFQNFPKQEF